MKLRTKLIIALVVVALAVLSIVVLPGLLNLRSIFYGNPTGPASTGAITLSMTLNGSTTVYYGNGQGLAEHAVVSYTGKNVTNATIDASIYDRSPIQRIYLINTSGYCSQVVRCFDENKLEAALGAALGGYDLVRNSSSFSYVNVSDIPLIPRNSIVIVPSGLMPLPLVAPGSQSGIYGMLDKGDTIIYTGKDFSYVLGPDGQTLQSPQNITSSLARYDLGTGQPQPGPYSKFQGNFIFNKPTFVLLAGNTLGNLTYIASSKGMFLAFSNYPMDAWSNVSAMASDVAMLVNMRLWLNKLGQQSETIGQADVAAGNLGVFVNLPKTNLTSSALIINNSYTLITLKASNSQGSAVKYLAFKNSRFKSHGVLGAADVVGEGQQVPILISISNKTGQTLVHIDIYDRNSSYVGTVPIGFISSSFGVLKYHTFTLPTGYYILSLKDFDNNAYASSYFFIANTTITPSVIDFKNGTFTFTAYSNGLPVSNATYSMELNGAYNTTGTVTPDGKITYSVPKGTVIGYGTQIFEVLIFGTKYQIKINNVLPSAPYIPPIYIEFAIAIIVVVLLNLILKPPKRDEYYIDVPEFPLSKKEKVTVPRLSMMGVFDKVNYYYHWRFMPLTVEEIRLGINNNIRINSMPVSITTQNANTVLSQLVAGGYLVNAENYYAPKAWLDTCRHDMEYLVIFRKMRDYCVSHATLFTDLDTDANVDMIMTKEGKQASVLIYSNLSKIKKMEVSKDSKIFVVFLDEETRTAFSDALYEAYGDEAEALKLGIEYNYIRLIDCHNLDKIVI